MVDAVQFKQFGLDHLEVVDYEPGQPGAGEVRIAVRSVSLNYRDLMMVQGTYNPRLTLPLVPCSDGSGVVVAVGDGVDDLKVGDHVCSTMIPAWNDGVPEPDILKSTLGGPKNGLLARECVLPQEALIKLPGDISFQEAACLPVAGLTAWSALVTEGQVTAGSTVLLLGTGGVSMMALGIAKKLGAEVVITSGSDEKLAKAASLGADHLINYKTEPKWFKRVLELYPAGVDCVLEVGGEGTFNQSVKATRIGGFIALIGVLAASEKPVNLTAVLMKRIRVQGILVGSRSEFADYRRFVQQHRPPVMIDSVYQGLGSAAEAFRHLQSGRHQGKLVIDV